MVNMRSIVGGWDEERARPRAVQSSQDFRASTTGGYAASGIIYSEELPEPTFEITAGGFGLIVGGFQAAIFDGKAGYYLPTLDSEIFDNTMMDGSEKTLYIVAHQYDYEEDNADPYSSVTMEITDRTDEIGTYPVFAIQVSAGGTTYNDATITPIWSYTSISGQVLQTSGRDNMERTVPVWKGRQAVIRTDANPDNIGLWGFNGLRWTKVRENYSDTRIDIVPIAPTGDEVFAVNAMYYDAENDIRYAVVPEISSTRVIDIIPVGNLIPLTEWDGVVTVVFNQTMNTTAGMGHIEFKPPTGAVIKPTTTTVWSDDGGTATITCTNKAQFSALISYKLNAVGYAAAEGEPAAQPGEYIVEFQGIPKPTKDTVFRYTVKVPKAVPTADKYLPFGAGFIGNVTVDWGDNTPVQRVQAVGDIPTHTYLVGNGAEYTITIAGTCSAGYKFSTGDNAYNVTTPADIVQIVTDPVAIYTGIDFSYFFNRLTAVRQYPANLGYYWDKITNASYMFRYSTATSARPAKLFENSKATNLECNLRNAWERSENVFNTTTNDWLKDCRRVGDMQQAFYYSKFTGTRTLTGWLAGSSVINLSLAFSYIQRAGTESLIIGDDFANNTNKLTLATGIMQNSTALTKVGNRFMSTVALLTNALQLWTGATNLTQVGDDILKDAPQLTTAEQILYNLANLVSIGDNFVRNTKKLSNMNNFCGLCPKLATFNMAVTDEGWQYWERGGKTGYPASVAGAQAFRNDTLLPNYNQIPAGWK